jgi:signal transduction histidine kinase
MVKKGIEISGESFKLKLLSNDKAISDEIINNSRSMISIINREYVYEKVNSTFCNAHQVSMDSVVGKSLGDVWGHETFLDIIKSNLDLCFLGKTIRYEALFSTARSGKRYYEVVFRPIMVKEGEITHLLAETFDINDLRQSELAAIAKEEELRKFETNLPIGFLRCDPDGKIIHANKAFLKIMDCNSEFTITSKNLKSFYPDDSLFYLHIDQLNDSSTQSFGRVTLKNCSNKEIPCRLSGFMAMDESGSPSFIDFAIEDSSRELMLENRLLQAQKLETIGALAGGIAHDFNNILATISGYAEMLHDDLSGDSELAERAARIQVAVIKARSITNQILTFSRQVEQEKVLVRVSEVLSETIGFVRSAAPSDIIIKSRITGKKANVFADPTQLFRVFLNLMTNAVQSMEDSGGTLSVSMEIVEGKLIRHELNKDIVADEYVLLVFKDTGKGMESSFISRVFEPFFTTREVGKGTGLGLSVVHGIITELEGEIMISSKKEKGSVFYVYLPVSKEYHDFSLKNDRKKKILFISGNKYESKILSLALQSSGYKLIYTSDRKSFLKVMSSENERPDLIIYMSDSKQIKPTDLIGIFEEIQIKTPCILINDPNHGLLEEKLLNSGIVMQQLIKPVSLKEIGNAIQSTLI